MKELYKLHTAPAARPENVIQGDCYRITMLTDRLVRLEYSEDGIFEDHATQTVLNRDFPKVEYSVRELEDQLEIFTKHLHIIYNRKAFSPRGLSIQLQGYAGCGDTWHYGEPMRNLGGTARTLDEVDGACELGTGLMSRRGAAVLDDSRSLLIDEDGWVQPRKKGICDLYFFGYGHDYTDCLNDFYYLCGKTPMLPRYALGNWWSRYYKYTEQSYMELMERFDEEGIPFTVAVVDMDWHLVDIDPKYGTGWTGYTWNKEFFPDPERFMKWLHDRGMKITLNVHPADGVRGHEEMYPQMAEAMGIDPATEEPVNFDITDRKFLDAYFDVVHHPLEEQGVDFWWIDWQQGGNTKMEGLDPLWMLNHFHYLDKGRDGKRPMTFSRYAGPGSHRYPVGFSGDTHVTWDSLDFQPYFTSTASNIGYGWWSHDIGGHMFGEKNDEMAGRWLQFGVFSPVTRLHSTCNEFNGKEPWRYKPEVRHMMGEFLRLRHRMMPYLYTMNYRAYSENRPITEPMYYRYPEENAAYEVKNQYFFGTELMVAAITTPRIPNINRSKIKVWIPEGVYFDIFTGMTYRGGRNIEMYRDIDTIPVLAKAGSILPFTDEISGAEAEQNPASLTVKFYGGDDGSFLMYEDENDTCGYEKGICVRTEFSLNWKAQQQSIVLHSAQGELSLIPQNRSYTVELYGCRRPEDGTVTVTVDGKPAAAEITYDASMKCLKLMLPEVSVSSETVIAFGERLELAENDLEEVLFAFLDQAEIAFETKSRIIALVRGNMDRLAMLSELRAMELDSDLTGCVMEVLTA